MLMVCCDYGPRSMWAYYRLSIPSYQMRLLPYISTIRLSNGHECPVDQSEVPGEFVCSSFALSVYIFDSSSRISHLCSRPQNTIVLNCTRILWGREHHVCCQLYRRFPCSGLRWGTFARSESVRYYATSLSIYNWYSQRFLLHYV